MDQEKEKVNEFPVISAELPVAQQGIKFTIVKSNKRKQLAPYGPLGE